MKKALIISYYWPPAGGAGVQRWLKFVKYLRLYGWEPIVFTPSNPESPETDESLLKDIPENTEVIKIPIWEPYTFYKRLQGKKKGERIQAAFLSEKKQNPFIENLSVWIRGNIFIPDARKFWIRPSVKFLVNRLRKEPVDVIISSGPPHTTHIFALQVSGTLGIPWIADFRDPWTQIDFYHDLKLSAAADKKHHRMERSVLEQADAVTVISPSMATDFRGLFDRSYEVITNGYDEEDTVFSGVIETDSKFSIAHIGTLTGSRNPVSLWKALSGLVNEMPELQNDLEIKLVGKVDYSVTESLEAAGLGRFVKRTEYLPHSEVVKVQQQSQVLLLLINNTPNAKSILTGKFFEYMASGRPVLCIGPCDGDAAAILKETETGLISGFDDLEGARANIHHFYHLFKEGRLEVSGKNTARFSRKELTGKMAAIMDSVIRK